MIFIDEKDTKKWLLEKNLIGIKGELSLSKYIFSTDLKIPTDSGRKTNISRAIGSLFNFPEESLLWINEFGIWPSCEDRYLFDGFRKSIGEEMPLHMKPGHIFSNKDLNNVTSLLAMVLYFVWGAVIVPSSKEFLMRISHDEYLMIYSKDNKILSHLKEELGPYFD